MPALSARATGWATGWPWLRRWLAAAALISSSLPAASARADRTGDLGKQIIAYESEVRDLGATLPRPGRPNVEGQERRLVDAQVAFSLGKHDSAALMLYDLVQKSGNTAEGDTALYYLAEALMQKGDRVAARGYFNQLVGNVTSGAPSKYYQQALERLIELSIALGDPTGVEEWQAALIRISPAMRRPSVPYVLGKYAFSQGKYDEALALFREVPKGSAYELQALYFSGATLIAKKDLGRATEVFDDLVNRKPKSTVDRRVIELSQLALGRVFYERDQPSKSIDSYLLVDRKSDLFPDALYEVGWVYVKSKQYDKALGALELLALSDPASSKTATVQILEGNLRIRKAQMIKEKQIAGIESGGLPETEYDKARALFTITHGQYAPSYNELERMLAAKEDATQFLAQITGRSSRIFQVNSAMPEVAAAWVREEPEVQRVVSVESDLAQIEGNIREAELTIERLEGLLGAPRRGNVYPPLVERRNRLIEIQEALISARTELATQQAALVSGPAGASAQAATARRTAVGTQLSQLPNAAMVYADRLARAQEEFTRFDESLFEIEAVLGSTDAMSVALRKFGRDVKLPPEQQATIDRTLAEVSPEVEALRNAMSEVNREIILGRDLAGTGDEVAVQAVALRRQMRQAQDEEQRALAAAQSGSRDAKQSQRLAGLADSASRTAAEIERIDASIDGLVDEALKEVRVLLEEERRSLAEYKAEFVSVEAESHQLGGEVLAGTFSTVKGRLYDVVIRSDVGVIDVSWSQKEEADADLKRYNLARQRELKQLRDEFRDILEEAKANAAKQAPALPPPVVPAPSPDAAPATQPTPPAAGTTPATTPPPPGPASKPAPAAKAAVKASTAGKAGKP
jgi:tetratricopeptide (TPR) repeat protein